MGFDFFLIQPQLDGVGTVMRLLVALACGGLIGWDREKHNKAAGFRTHILISVGSCMVMEAGILMALPQVHMGTDPTRMAAQILSGIGFLGAGAIFRFGIDVKGLTTAASIWAVAAIGLASGGGMYFLTISGTFLMLFVLHVLEPLSKRISPHNMIYSLRLKGEEVHLRLSRLREIAEDNGIRIDKICVSKKHADTGDSLSCHLWTPHTFQPEIFVEEVGQIPGVKSVDLDSVL